LAFDSRPYGQADIFLLACDAVAMHCGQPARVAAGGAAESPGWSADGKFLYFACRRTGRPEIWKQPVSRRSAGAGVATRRIASRESWDGQWLYFTRVGGDSIWRMTVQQPFREELVVGPPFKVQTEGWAVTADEAVFHRPAFGQESGRDPRLRAGI
jgi:Tol biopolymer transport system component